MAEKNSVRIKIFGVEYVLKGDSDPEAMQELAAIVDARMRELGVPGTAQTHRVAILAAFYFADELMKTRRALESERQRYDQAARAAAGFDLKLQGLLHEGDERQSQGRGLMVEEAPADQEGSSDM